MKDIAPEIKRKRLIFEGRYGEGVILSKENMEDFLIKLTELLGMTRVHGPLVSNWAQEFKPEKYAGFEGWIMWTESGAQLYVWEKLTNLLTVDIFTCKDFDEKKAIKFISNWFDCEEYEFMVIP